jgi:hypothetical protein
MPVTLPFVPSTAFFRVGTVLDGSTYIFDVRWNSREQAFFFDVLEVDETPIASGSKIVLGTYLCRTSNHPLFATGVMVAIDLSGELREATLDDLGTRVVVRRFTGPEMATQVTAP